jgi:hypothetical protein
MNVIERIVDVRNVYKYWFVLATVLLLVAGSIAAQSTESDLKEPGSSDTEIDQISWITGHWRAEALDGICEEIWSPPLGNSMMGMFRLVKDDSVVFYELMTISMVSGKPNLKIKHFNADMTGWEEKDESTEFHSVSLSDSLAVFDGLSFLKQGEDGMQVTVTIENDGEMAEIEFPFRRVKN